MQDDHLIIGVTSRALFDLEKEHQIFETQGFAAYRDYQLKNKEVPLKPGVAFSFVRRLLRLNKRFSHATPFKVIILSRNSPATGQRIFYSCKHYGLDIEAGAFTSGQSTLPLLDPYKVNLFLSANRDSVMQAIEKGHAAGLVLPNQFGEEHEVMDDDGALRIGFDFDGVLIDDESERVFQEHGLEGFNAHEKALAQVEHTFGPLSDIFRKLSHFQHIDMLEHKEHLGDTYKPLLRIAIITARGSQSSERLVKTLSLLGGSEEDMNATELYLLDGRKKEDFLKVIRPHIFFDDQIRHLQSASSSIPCVLVPIGVHNKETPT